MAPAAIELHDATVDAFEEEDGDVVLACTVYVAPTEDGGEGAFQEAVIRIKDGALEGAELEVPCLLEGGALSMGGKLLDGVLPAPLEREGEIALMLAQSEGSELIIRGSGIEIELPDNGIISR